MPYRVGEIATHYGIAYYPIVSSGRAFRAMWKRAFHKYGANLGGVVYEDPWLAGGHNGLTNSEDPRKPQPPMPRVQELRDTMRACGAPEVPIVMAGGVWFLRDWQEWIDNPQLGPIAFQFGTRPLLTKESPVAESWQERLLSLKPGDVLLHKFSPTGFYSSAVRNTFLNELCSRLEREVPCRAAEEGDFTAALPLGPRGRPVYLKPEDLPRAQGWVAAGYTSGLKTPDETMIFVTPEKAAEIIKDQADCMGCLSACAFSNWWQVEAGTTGKRADPRSFCIQKSLQNIAHGMDVDHELMFSGHNAHLFGTDPFFANGNIPTVAELVARIMTGD
jgi:hypothetical protein